MPTEYGTVSSHDAEEIALADEEVDLARGGIKKASAVSTPSGGDPLASAMEAASAAKDAAANAIASTPLREKLNEYSSDAISLARNGRDWILEKQERRQVAGVAAFFLFLFLIWPSGEASTEIAATQGVAAGSASTLSAAPADIKPMSKLGVVRRLPCWTGSCNNVLFEQNSFGNPPLDDAMCDAFAGKFGCAPCKRLVPPEISDVLGTVHGHVAVCEVVPTPGRTETLQGWTYTAIGPAVVPQALAMHRLPCWTGSCNNYLLEPDQQTLLKWDSFCNFWASEFGCSDCKDPIEQGEDARLAALLGQMPAKAAPEGGPAARGRVVLCEVPLAAGTSHLASGITYTVDEGFYTPPPSA